MELRKDTQLSLSGIFLETVCHESEVVEEVNAQAQMQERNMRQRFK